MMQIRPNFRKIIPISTLTALLSTSLVSPFFSQPVQAQSVLQRIQSLFTRKRSEGAASGRSRAGVSRSQCSELDANNLIALVPESNEGLTTNKYPNFLFFVPFGGSAKSPPAKFRLLDEQKNPVLKNPILLSLPKQKGLVSLKLPSSEKPLQVGKRYNWYFSISCTNQQGTPTIFDVNGWIKLVAPNSALVQQLKKTPPQNQYAVYAENDLWFDTVNQLAKYRTVHQKEWTELLSLYGLAELPQTTITELRIQK
ncbi:DUF928 domain-containing protein [Desmonostoc muscorum LEGE 12446]|uniref:DUF928 domain-containing protein n=1 Tax=Desmonostoc muscorum LEGE 12446 TaxID=1828758 RepID=A0A8J6ZKX0_DESMC|nr:DUF928 domain-containing protein [Desmonostoc muscorum]MCF2150245.1 DUF928 domain-containing protein [Desmonostoc muscorum LEGE 12446]